MTTETLTIRRDTAANCYTVTTDQPADWLELFGTDTLPTPHGLSASADDVVAHVAGLNPGCRVVMA